MATVTTAFKYPDVPYTDNRTLYDYRLLLHDLIRKLGKSINDLQQIVYLPSAEFQEFLDAAKYLQAQIDAINTQIGSINNSLGTFQTQIDSLNNSMTTVTSDVTDLQNDVAAIQSDISTMQTDIADLQAAMTTAQADIATAQNDILLNKADLVGVHLTLVDLQNQIDELKNG